MNSFINKRVNPGQKIAKHTGEVLLQGLYYHNEFVYASIVGNIQQHESGAFYVSNKFPVQCFDIRVGDIVYGQITRIR